jgi:hypothetical protein
MSPWELCKGGTEHGHQRALFAWSKIAEQYGFDAAWDKQTYEAGGKEYAESTYGTANACWPLKWFHATPNGGSLGDSKQSQQIRGAQKKAEGVKAGVYDTFLPWPSSPLGRTFVRHGLWLEMKKPGEIKKRSLEQKSFSIAMIAAGYACAVADNWEDAARWVQLYMSGGIIECPVHNAN